MMLTTAYYFESLRTNVALIVWKVLENWSHILSGWCF